MPISQLSGRFERAAKRHQELTRVKCTHCTLSSADYCTRMIARWCDTIILYGSKEVLGYAGVLNVDCENNQGSPEQSPRRWNYLLVHSWVWL